MFGCVLSQEENREKVQKGDYDVFILVGLKFSLHLTLCAMLLDVILVVFYWSLEVEIIAMQAEESVYFDIGLLGKKRIFKEKCLD